MGPGPVTVRPLPLRWWPSQAPGLVLPKRALRPLCCGFTFCPWTVCHISHICVTREGCKGPYLMRSCRNMKKGVRRPKLLGPQAYWGAAQSGLTVSFLHWWTLCYLTSWSILLSLPLKSWMNLQCRKTENATWDCRIKYYLAMHPY